MPAILSTLPENYNSVPAFKKRKHKDDFSEVIHVETIIPSPVWSYRKRDFSNSLELRKPSDRLSLIFIYPSFMQVIHSRFLLEMILKISRKYVVTIRGITYTSIKITLREAYPALQNMGFRRAKWFYESETYDLDTCEGVNVTDNEYLDDILSITHFYVCTRIMIDPGVRNLIIQSSPRNATRSNALPQPENHDNDRLVPDIEHVADNNNDLSDDEYSTDETDSD